MDCGKSTLALQVDHNQSRQGRHGLRLTQGDRSRAARISSRVGLSQEAVELDAGTDVRLLVRDRWAAGHRVDYVVVDEAQFLTGAQVEQLAELVDQSHVDVYAFGLTTDFRAHLFTGTQRLFELADVVQRIQVEVLCWCGAPGLLNAGWSAGRWSARARPSSSPTPPPTPPRTATRTRCATRCSAAATTSAGSSAPPPPAPAS